MSNLFVSLLSAGNSLQVFSRGLTVVQNNVNNVNTPGYAKQKMLLESLRFQPEIGLPGGVGDAGLLDSRSPAAEQGVRRQLSLFGSALARVRQLERLEPVFEMREGAGLGAAMDSLFQSFSALTVTPNDTAAREVALQRAQEVASAFNGMAGQLGSVEAQADADLRDSLDQLAELSAEIAGINHALKQDFRAQEDPGLAARLNDLTQQIASLTEVTVLRAEDGSVSVFAGGQVPLVMGDRQFSLTADFSTGDARVFDSEGNDVSAKIGTGSVGGLLEFRNETLDQAAAEIDSLASTLADRINTTLAGGADANGNTPGAPLFTYNPAQGAARTLSVTGISPDQLAMAAAGSPGGNEVALALAALGSEKTMNGYTFAQFYGTVAAAAGRELENARAEEATSEALVAQAMDLRQQLQGVNLDEEAALLLQYQKAYEAASTLVRTLDEMLESAIQMIR